MDVPPALICELSVCGKKLIFLSVTFSLIQGMQIQSSGLKLKCKVHNRNISNTLQL